MPMLLHAAIVMRGARSLCVGGSVGPFAPAGIEGRLWPMPGGDYAADTLRKVLDWRSNSPVLQGHHDRGPGSHRQGDREHLEAVFRIHVKHRAGNSPDASNSLRSATENVSTVVRGIP